MAAQNTSSTKRSPSSSASRASKRWTISGTRLIADGGEESKCGWLKDKFGLSWQVVPTALGRYLSDPDRKKADRAMQAMMKMQKIVIADLDNAYAG